MQEVLYPSQVLEVRSSAAQHGEMKISLRDARKRAGLSQEALGVAAQSGRSTIVKLETGSLPMTEEWAKRLAPHLGVKPHHLYEGPQIRVVGYVGAGQRVYAYDDMQGAGETITRPPMTVGDLLAVEVKGESMLPLRRVLLARRLPLPSQSAEALMLARHRGAAGGWARTLCAKAEAKPEAAAEPAADAAEAEAAPGSKAGSAAFASRPLGARGSDM